MPPPKVWQWDVFVFELHGTGGVEGSNTVKTIQGKLVINLAHHLKIDV